MQSKDPIQYIIYIKDTQDEKYLERVYDNINSDYIIKTKIEEL